MNNNEIKLEKKIKKQHNVLILLFLLSFLFTDIVKEILLQNTGLNLKLSIFPALLILYLSAFYRRNNWAIVLVLFILIYSILGSINYNYGINVILRFTNTILIPVLLITIDIYEPQKIMKRILKIFNIVVAIYVLFGTIDYLTDGSIRSIMINILKDSYYTKSMTFDSINGTYRWFSLFGHPLVNTAYIIIFIISNIIYVNKYNENICFNIYIIYLISILGMVLSNSKIGLIIMVVLLICNIANEKRKVMYISIISLFIILAINSDYFSTNVISRFQYAIESGDITNGRLTVLNEILNRNMYDLDLFLGKGMASSDRLVAEVFGSYSGLSNMEIPFLMFLYEYGVFATLSIYFVMYLYPVYILLIRKKISIFILYSLLFIFLNTFNGIATGTGLMILSSYMMMFYLNIGMNKPIIQEK